MNKYYHEGDGTIKAVENNMENSTEEYLKNKENDLGEYLMNRENDLEVVMKMLKYANVPSFDESGEQDGSIDLTSEVVWSAMSYLKNNPGKSIEDACEFGLDEWIK